MLTPGIIESLLLLEAANRRMIEDLKDAERTVSSRRKMAVQSCAGAKAEHYNQLNMGYLDAGGGIVSAIRSLGKVNDSIYEMMKSSEEEKRKGEEKGGSKTNE